MRIDLFKHEIKQYNGVWLTKDVMLLKRPLQLYDYTHNKVLAIGKKIDDLLDIILSDGKTVRQLIEGMEKITFSLDGGRGASSGGEKTFKFDHASGGGGGGSIGGNDFPSRFNIRVENPDKTLQSFRTAHVNDEYESGVTVDERGFVTQYVHGDATSVGIWGKKGEMVYHNHPSGGAFSDNDLISTSMTAAKGIVASGIRGDYIFKKSKGFRPEKFIKAVKNARPKGKSYDDAVDKWLKANQKKYGYSYAFVKA